ncbi:MAG: hypothetical protein L3K15_05275 [Thermoplasmata archaeon]|nr:hypothetical protein [Thermoplasmata archaeon]
MVVKRQCSFCANEIEPGTGTLFVKRDGTVFSFCSSSCRKQQLHLGRVGHRLKWTRAHALKVASEQRTAPARARTPVPSTPSTPESSTKPPATETAAPAAEAHSAEKTPRAPRAPKSKSATDGKKPGAEATPSKPAKATKPRKSKSASEGSEKTAEV